jgi:hypothetical protein
MFLATVPVSALTPIHPPLCTSGHITAGLKILSDPSLKEVSKPGITSLSNNELWAHIVNCVQNSFVINSAETVISKKRILLVRIIKKSRNIGLQT